MRNIIVTGGSRGIGAATCKKFLDAGDRVLIISRTEPEYLNSGDWGERAVWCKCDVTDGAQIDAVFDRLDSEFGGKIDVVVNNVGVQVAKTVDETTDEEWDWLTAINITATFRFARQAIRRMRAAGKGSIVNIGSIAGDTSDYYLPLYSASKGWVHSFTRALATDHGKHGIRANAIGPTWTMTEMSQVFFDSEPDPAAARAGVTSRHPLGRLAEPDDIADAVIWMASDQSKYVNGQCLMVDGGMTVASSVNPDTDLG